ncbi:unnamed protein product, partial [Laminaria digitata]
MSDAPRILYTGTRDPARFDATPASAKITHAPMLRARSLDLVGTLAARWLEDRATDCGIVIYSRHALASLVESGVLEPGRAIEVFCVGERTAERAREVLHGAMVHTAPADAQTFLGLARYLVERPALPSRLVSLGLSGRPRPLAQHLEARAGVEGIEQAAYETLARDDVSALPAPEKLDWVALTSPRTARAWRDLVLRLEDPEAQRAHLNLRRASIGPTTARACAEEGIPCELVADRPDAE